MSSIGRNVSGLKSPSTDIDARRARVWCYQPTSAKVLVSYFSDLDLLLAIT